MPGDEPGDGSPSYSYQGQRCRGQRVMTKRQRWIPFFAGALGSMIGALVVIVLAQLWQTPSPAQLLTDRITALLPLSIFAALLGALEAAAKPLVFLLILIGYGLIGGLVALLAQHLLARNVRQITVAVGMMALFWLAHAVVLAPLGGVGIVGRSAQAGPLWTSLAFLIGALSFAVIVMSGVTPGSDQTVSVSERRRFLRLGAYGLLGLVAAGYALRFAGQLFARSSRAPVTDAQGLTPALTPTADFYVVSKNFVDPKVDPSSWQLTVTGHVAHPLTLRYTELKARPALSLTTTLECISNDVGGDLISTGQWTGIRLADLLQEAQPLPDVVDVVFHAADGYSDSIPLMKALQPTTLLVYALNGEPLPTEHGFPARIIVPNIYGMKNVKWLTAIELVPYDFKGYWQERGWSDSAIVQTMSRIDVPHNGERIPLGGKVLIGGIAFAGERGISRVEVSLDGGESWAPAMLEPPLSPLTWVRWRMYWQPRTVGAYRIVVRAWDGTGSPQDAKPRPPLPDGATGLHTITVRVVQS